MTMGDTPSFLFSPTYSKYTTWFLFANNKKKKSMGGVTHLPAAGGSPKEGRVENQREAEREENIFPI